MISVLRAEWIKVRTVRVHWILITVAVAFPTVVAALVGIFNPNPQWVYSRDLVDIVSGVGVVSLLLMASLWVINLTSEYAHGTIRVTYAAVPTRWKVLASKAIVGTLVTLAAMTLTFWLAWFVGSTILNGRGASIGLGDEGVDAAGVFVSLLALAVIVSWFALGVGAIIRNSPASVVVVLLWPLLIENLVALALTLAGVDSANKWMPYQSAIQAVSSADSSPDVLGRPAAQLYFGAVALGLLLIGGLLDRRRDA
jgi:ABC-2 type transport system permease protein